jgi:hypothetical protein
VGGIATKVQIFNEAYKLAWDQMMADPDLMNSPGLAVRLRDNIQILMKTGMESAELIAAEAIARMKA